LHHRLLEADEAYGRAVEQAGGLAIGARLQRGLTGPAGASTAVAAVVPPSKAHIVSGRGGALNPFLEEQLLADALGEHERKSRREVDVDRLGVLFRPVLRRTQVDATQRDTDWFRSALFHDDEYVAMTDRGRYVAMMSRAAIVNSVLLALTQA
jgi:hypothetical protein